MPNMVENILIVNGSQADRERFLEENKSEEEALSFQNTVPMPDDADGGECEAVWGTDDHPSDVLPPKMVDGVLRYNFLTRRTPATTWLVTASALYPSLRFKLRWEVDVERGETVIRDGATVHYESWERDQDDADVSVGVSYDF